MYLLCAALAELFALVILYVSQNGRTPLYLACEKNYIQIAQLLLSKGATVNLGSNVSKTIFHVSKYPSEQLSNITFVTLEVVVVDHISQNILYQMS